MTVIFLGENKDHRWQHESLSSLFNCGSCRNMGINQCKIMVRLQKLGSHQHLGEKEWFSPPMPGSFLLRRNSCSFSFTSVLAMAPGGRGHKSGECNRTRRSRTRAWGRGPGAAAAYSLCLSLCSSAAAAAAPDGASPALRAAVAPASSSAPSPAAAWPPAAPVVAKKIYTQHRIIFESDTFAFHFPPGDELPSGAPAAGPRAAS